MIAALPLPTTLDTRAGPLTLRDAAPADLDALLLLLADDPVSAARGDVAADHDRPAYARALTELSADPTNTLLVACAGDEPPVAMLQLTRIPGLARRGATRLQVEAVRVSSQYRSGGIGSALMRWVVDVAAPALDVQLVQLTSDASRADAHRFYQRLGFVASHVGFKYRIG